MSLKSFAEHLTAKATRKEKKKSKYRSTKTNHKGLSFGSKLEAAVYDALILRLMAGEIKEIAIQDSVYMTLANILYKPDFKCTLASGDCFWVEAKGFKTPVWMIKKRLWLHYGPGVLEIYEGSHTNPKLVEIIKSKGEK